MAIFSATYENFNDLLSHQLWDTSDALHRMGDAFGKMADKAGDPELAGKLTQLQANCDQHRASLTSVFEATDVKEDRQTCQATKGLVAEASDTIGASGDADVIDAALIANAQRMAHYLIATFGTVRNFARRAGHASAADTLQGLLDAWYTADRDLTDLAESRLNAEAVS